MTQAFTRSLAVKLSGAAFLLILVLLSAFAWGITHYARVILERKGIEQIQAQTELVLAMITSYDAALTQETGRLMRVLTGELPGPFAIDPNQRIAVGAHSAPALRAGDTLLNADLGWVDRFSDLTGAVATLFVRDGDDFLRVATSLQDSQGERAMGTYLGTQHPGYQALLSGKAYSGKATLFGRDYMTWYEPIAVEGRVVAVLFVGLDFTEGLTALKQQIRDRRIADTGYFYVLDATPGPHYGELVVHPAKEGSSVLAAKDASGHTFIAEMLENQQGVVRYPWMNSELGDRVAREKITLYDAYPSWGWVIAGGSYLDEFARDARHLRTAMLAASIALLLTVGVALPWMTRRMVARPLREVVAIFTRIGRGDFSSRIESRSQDEIGTLLKSLAAMQVALTERAAADQHATDAMRRLTSALDTASTSMMVADENGTLIHLNPAFIKMMREAEADIRREIPGFRVDGLIGRSFIEFHKHPEHQRSLLEGLSGTYVSQMRIAERTYKLIVNPVRNESGDRLGTVVEWVDRTAEVAAEDELDALLDAVAHGDFSGRLSLEGKQGFFRDLAEGMNHLNEIVTKALDDLARVLKALAQADLRLRIEPAYHGRFGELKDDTNTTVAQLESLVHQILEATDAINTAASEIAAGNADLSGRTEAQAGSLEETATAMERFNASVRQNAQSAVRAQELSEQTNARAVAGGTLVARVVTTMGGIQSASQKIADITGVIDSLAFQTNILALNAAVEAARAGEQGRGFAVVAAEVRTLAQRSAQAAKEIKMLIGDSVAQVEAGAEVVEETGTTMETIVASFQQVAGLIGEIAAASREQERGIGQVTQAITQMDELTQRNAALVEESAAAAESLEEQARDLRRTVSVFQLDETARAARTDAAGTGVEVNFDDLVYVHRQWGKKLRRAVEGRSAPQDPAAVSRDDGCALGKWLYGDGRHLAEDPAYIQLREKHANFHRCAGQVLQHVVSGERDRGARLLSEHFGALSTETVERIRALEARVSQLRASPRVDARARLPRLD